MARCGCAADRCACHFVAGDNVIITGSGTRSNPYVVESVATQVVDPGGDDGGGGSTDPEAGRFSGEIVSYASDTAPPGWLVCDGSEISRSIYSNLFAVIGTRYGSGDGTSTFALPDLRGRFPLGASSSIPVGVKGGSANKTLSIANIPAHTHSLPSHDHSIPSHDHDMTHNHPAHVTTFDGSHDHMLKLSDSDGSADAHVRRGAGLSEENAAPINHDGYHQHEFDVPIYYGDTGNWSGDTGTWSGTSGSTGNGQSFDVMNPYLAVTYIIKT